MQNGIKKIEIDYSPFPAQREVHDAHDRFKILACGRRWGKTTLAVNEIIKNALTRNNSKIFYIAPTYRQSKMIAFSLIKKYLPFELINKINESELIFYLKNGSEICLKGADNEDTLRGVGLTFVVLDELGSMKGNVWQEIVRPMLIDTNGNALFIGTPKGRNHFYDLYMKGFDNNVLDWKSWHYPTSSNPYINPSEIIQAKRDMSERLYAQEFEASFLSDETGVFKRVRQCIAGEFESPVVGRYYVMGIDLAKSVDFTVLTIIDSLTRHVVYFERFQDVLWTEQKLRIQSVSKRFGRPLCVIDGSGVGDPIVEDLQNSGVSVDSFKFTNESKSQLIENLAIAIEQRQITFPNIEELIKELMEYEYSITDGGRIKYGAPSGKHDDCVTSLALAVWGIRHQLHEAQIVKDDFEIQWEEDKQGKGTLVTNVEDEEFQGVESGY